MSELVQAKSAIANDFLCNRGRIRFDIEVLRQAWLSPSAYPLGTNN